MQNTKRTDKNINSSNVNDVKLQSYEVPTKPYTTINTQMIFIFNLNKLKEAPMSWDIFSKGVKKADKCFTFTIKVFVNCYLQTQHQD